jgi:hypothetical protein
MTIGSLLHGWKLAEGGVAFCAVTSASGLFLLEASKDQQVFGQGLFLKALHCTSMSGICTYPSGTTSRIRIHARMHQAESLPSDDRTRSIMFTGESCAHWSKESNEKFGSGKGLI